MQFLVECLPRDGNRNQGAYKEVVLLWVLTKVNNPVLSCLNIGLGTVLHEHLQVVS